jgi:hypothetical protein
VTRTSLMMLAYAALIGGGTGCSGSRYVPVAGRVTLNGKPLTAARVSFQPDAAGAVEGGMGSVGTTDETGRYELKVIGTADAGAKVGRHVVTVSKTDIPVKPEDFDKPDARVPKEVLPARYNTATELSFEVPESGTTDANLDLKTP